MLVILAQNAGRAERLATEEASPMNWRLGLIFAVVLIVVVLAARFSRSRRGSGDR
jgi:nicotinamide riboside transporter PnuC